MVFSCKKGIEFVILALDFGSQKLKNLHSVGVKSETFADISN